MTRLVRRGGRLLVWGSLVALSALGGAFWRFGRRLLRRPPRIWHGFWPLHCVVDQVAVDRLAGYPSVSVMNHTSHLPYAIVTDDEFDVVWEALGWHWDHRHWLSLCHLLLHGDIWRAYFDCVFFPTDRKWSNEIAFRLVRACGIRIIAVPQGGDVIHRVARTTRFRWVERFELDYPDWNLSERVSVVRERIRLFCRHSILVFTDSVLSRFIPRRDVAMQTNVARCDVLDAATETGNGTPLIVHAPNHRNVKGSDILLSALDRLRYAGFHFDLRLVENVPRREAIAIYRSADIVADQFCMGGYSAFSLEGMTLGKPVIVYLDQEYLGDPSFSLPFVNANPENLGRALAPLIAIPELRARLGQAGRDAVERYQSPSAMAEVWARVYESVWWEGPMKLDQTRHYGRDRASRSFTEDPWREDYWPVPVGDLLSRIRESVALAR